MAFQGDPYRTLGIVPGASLNEIRSAYRRLAKQYHPDAAGERALPRFLAIQAAYERLVDGEGRLRTAGAGSSRRAEPWRADPARARASREAWRARRTGWTGAGGTTADRPGMADTRGEGVGGGPTEGPPGAPPRGEPRTDAPPRERRHGRAQRKATPGSTTYDEATELPRDPEWQGAGWYGPSSGTFWTINPREYADPRKHGPEYQARARRASRDADPAAADGEDDPAPPPGPEPAPQTGSGADGSTWRWTDAPGASTGTGTQDWGTRTWSYEPPTSRGRAATGTSATADDDPLPDLEALARRAAPGNLRALVARSMRWRIVLALVAWPPIGYAVGTLVAEASGCASFSAACPEPMPIVPLVLQPLVVLALIALPGVAAVGAFASLLGLAVALPVAAILSVGVGPEARVGAPVLAACVTLAYLVGLAWGTASGRRGAAPSP